MRHRAGFRMVLAIGLIALLVMPAFADEQLTLSAPLPVPSISLYSIDRVVFDWERALVMIAVRSNTGLAIELAYTGPTALTMMTALNTMNLSVKSLKRRILERLILDGKLPSGTVSGSPD